MVAGFFVGCCTWQLKFLWCFIILFYFLNPCACTNFSLPPPHSHKLNFVVRYWALYRCAVFTLAHLYAVLVSARFLFIKPEWLLFCLLVRFRVEKGGKENRKILFSFFIPFVDDIHDLSSFGCIHFFSSCCV